MKVVIVFVLLLIIAVLVVALSRVRRKGKRRSTTLIPPPGVAAAHPILVPREMTEEVRPSLEAEVALRRREHADSLGKEPVETGPPTEAWSMTDPFRPLDSRNSRTCPVCSAGPDQVCHTLTTHKPTKMHAARTKG